MILLLVLWEAVMIKLQYWHEGGSFYLTFFLLVVATILQNNNGDVFRPSTKPQSEEVTSKKNLQVVSRAPVFISLAQNNLFIVLLVKTVLLTGLSYR